MAASRHAAAATAKRSGSASSTPGSAYQPRCRIASSSDFTVHQKESRPSHGVSALDCRSRSVWCMRMADGWRWRARLARGARSWSGSHVHSQALTGRSLRTTRSLPTRRWLPTMSNQDRMTDIIDQQRQTISELQTPVIQVWDRILALPIVGSLDTARTADMNEALLQRIVDTGSEIVILDITAVPIVDTSVAKHLLETISAARLLGAEVFLVGLST